MNALCFGCAGILALLAAGCPSSSTSNQASENGWTATNLNVLSPFPLEPDQPAAFFGVAAFGDDEFWIASDGLLLHPLASGETRTVQVTLSPPKNAVLGSSDLVTLSASIGDPSIRNFAAARATIGEIDIHRSTGCGVAPGGTSRPEVGLLLLVVMGAAGLIRRKRT